VFLLILANVKSSTVTVGTFKFMLTLSCIICPVTIFVAETVPLKSSTVFKLIWNIKTGILLNRYSYLQFVIVQLWYQANASISKAAG
jgi:hypothetical protein